MTEKGKAVVAWLYAIAVVVVPFIDGGGREPSPAEGVQIAIAVVTAFAVHIAPIIPQAPWVKSAVGAVLAGLQVLVTVIVDGVQGNDVLMIVFAIASALGIVLAPAQSANGAAVGWGSDRLKYALAA